jgi:hypothetical protein
MSLSLGTAWNETVALARRKAGVVLPVAFLFLSLPPALLQLVAPVTAPGHLPEPGLWLLFVPPTIVLNLIGALALSRLALADGEDGGTAFAAGLKGFPALLGAAAIIALGAASLTIVAAQVSARVSAPLLSRFLLLLLLAAMVFFWARLALLTPAAALENIGSIRLIRRGWALSAGNVVKLIGVLLGAAIASLLALMVAGAAGGVAARLGPQPQPGMVALLLVSLISALLQAAIGGLVTIFLARLYAQRAAGR